MRRAIAALLSTVLAAPAAAQAPMPASDAETLPSTGDSVDPNRARALELYKQARGHYRAGEFRRAVDLLNEAYALHRAPVLLYNLARAHESAGDFEQALDAYGRYLEVQPDAADRGAIERRMQTLRGEIAERERLRRKAARPAPTPARSGPGVAPWLVAGAGGVVIGAGVFFGLRARSLHDQAGDERRALTAEEHQKDAERAATIATVSFIVGGALAVGGVTWGILAQPKEIAVSARF